MDILKGIDLRIPARAVCGNLWVPRVVARVRSWDCWRGSMLQSEGEVLLDGIPISKMAEDALAQVRGRKIGFVFQSYQLDSNADPPLRMSCCRMS